MQQTCDKQVMLNFFYMGGLFNHNLVPERQRIFCLGEKIPEEGYN